MMEQASASVFGSIATRSGRLVLAKLVFAVRHAHLSLLTVLIVAVFNPLFCVVHCTVLDTLSEWRTPPGSVRFVCHLTEASHASSRERGPVPDFHLPTPRAVYDGVLALIAFYVVLLLATHITPFVLLRRRGELPPPPPPPPKPVYL